MNQLDRINQESPVARVMGWMGRSVARDVVRQTALTQMKVEGMARATGHVMDCTARLDRRREDLATNQLLNLMLARVEQSFVERGMQLTGDMFTPWG